jgi:hypothetical protein
MGETTQAESAYRGALKINPDLVDANYNLAVLLIEANNYREAVRHLELTLSINPKHLEAHSNLGMVLKNSGRFEMAIKHLEAAIALNNLEWRLKQNLAIIHYAKGDINECLRILNKAKTLHPEYCSLDLLLAIIGSRNSPRNGPISSSAVAPGNTKGKLPSVPFIQKCDVDEGLLEIIRSLDVVDLNSMKDARRGNGQCFPSFNLFGVDRLELTRLANVLITVIEHAVGSRVHIYDSFFNILKDGGRTEPHTHLNELDHDPHLELGMLKYSLVYYISVGDQSGDDPGFLRLYDPHQEILPEDGMIVILPADRRHSSIYDGHGERIMVGVNFYCLE